MDVEPRGKHRLAFAAAALALLSACGQDASAPANKSQPTASPSAAAPATATGSLEEWLRGSWSYGEDCATDFAVHYNADGSLTNYEDEGRWSLDGNTVTESITSRIVMGEEEVEKVDPPETRRYTVERVDATHGVLVFEGKRIPILRC